MKKIQNSKAIIIFTISMFILLATIYYFYTSQPSSKTNQTQIETQQETQPIANEITSNNTQNGSETISFNDQTYKYINNTYGFSIKFPKFNRGPYLCKDLEKLEKTEIESGESPLKLFEKFEKGTGTIYISYETAVSVSIGMPLDETGYPSAIEVKDCTEVPNTIELLKNGYAQDPAKPNEISKLGSPEFLYRKVSNDSELQAFIKEFEKECFVGKKDPINKTPDVLEIILEDKDGKTYKDEETNCLPDYRYKYLYSPKNKVALFYKYDLNYPIFKGTNGQEYPEIEFLK